MEPDTTASALPAEPLAPGQVIDGFGCSTRALHQGGMANLWKVTRSADAPPLGSDLPLIMKVPRIKGGEDPASIVGFEVERMIMPALTGPHVPQFVARGDFTGQPYIVMERIEGTSLRPRLDAAPLAIDEVIEIGSRVATALHELHRQQLVHLDVKPSNIMFRPDGTAVLVDFGLSRHDAPARPAGRRVRAADGHRPVHVARAGAVRAQRPAQRPVRAGRDALPLHHRRAALRLARHRARPAPAAVSSTRCRRATCVPIARPGCRR
jgi:serine/threonine protein kinase